MCRKSAAQKNLGDAHRVPLVVACCGLPSASWLSSLLSFWLPWIYSPFPFFMEFRNGILLQLFECIESTQNEVKRKMIETGASNDAPKSLRNVSPEEKVCATRIRPLIAAGNRQTHGHLNIDLRHKVN
jgi:hypothetical protein